MPTAEPIDMGFSTAGADYPSMSYEDGNLILSFVDWQERFVHVIFRDVCRFEWSDEPDDTLEGEPYDGVCIVRNSGWIPRVAGPEYQHYRLNFNACGGRLDVACNAFNLLET